LQTKNIGIRLASLRRGAQGASVGGLSLAPVDERAPLPPIASTLPSSGLPALFGTGTTDAAITPSKLGLFINGQGSFGKHDVTEHEPGFDFHTTGMTLGADYRLTNQFILGTALGFLATDWKLDHGDGDLAAKGFSVSAFGTYYLKDVYYFDGIATYGWNWYKTRRQIASGEVAKGDPGGTQLAVSFGAGRDFTVRQLTVGPYARVDYVKVEIDSFHETGAGTSNLRMNSQDVTSVTTALGGRMSYAISTSWAVLLPTASAEWQHEFEANSRVIKASLASAPGVVLGAQTDNPDRNYFNLGIGLSATFRGGTAAFIHYDVVLGREHFTTHGFTAGIRFEF
jgi:outer membrane autotransporter protein